MSRRWNLAYGTETRPVQLPRDVLVLKPRQLKPLSDPGGQLQGLLRKSTLAAVVRPNDRVCIVVSDRTRSTGHRLWLPVLLDYLDLNRKAVVLFAAGAHRPMSRAEMEESLGPVSSRVECRAHDATDPDSCVELGMTERGTPVAINREAVTADHLLLTGSVVHHSFAGFGGGPKAVFPGLASAAAIAKNHSLMLQPGAEAGRLDGNPVYEDLTQACAMTGPRFLVNSVTTDGGAVAAIFAGEVAPAHREAAALVARACEVGLEAGADLVLASCGGHPRDIDLYQAMKSLENACRAVRPGGTVILLARCPEGVGHATFRRWLEKDRTPAALADRLRHGFELGGHKAWILSQLTARATVFLVSDIEPGLVEQFGLRPAASIEAAVTAAGPAPGARICLLPQAAVTVPCPTRLPL